MPRKPTSARGARSRPASGVGRRRLDCRAWRGTPPSCAGSTSGVTGSRTTSSARPARPSSSDVATFRASGNVIFTGGTARRPTRSWIEIESGLGETLGYEVPVFLRSAAEVTGIAQHQPFPAKLVAASGGKLQVSLLAATPSARAKKTVLAVADAEDRLAIRGRSVLASERGAPGVGARPERRRGRSRALDEADEGHDRAGRREVLRRLAGQTRTTILPSLPPAAKRS